MNSLKDELELADRLIYEEGKCTEALQILEALETNPSLSVVERLQLKILKSYAESELEEVIIKIK